jgi:hypothetical protein
MMGTHDFLQTMHKLHYGRQVTTYYDVIHLTPVHDDDETDLHSSSSSEELQHIQRQLDNDTPSIPAGTLSDIDRVTAILAQQQQQQQRQVRSYLKSNRFLQTIICQTYFVSQDDATSEACVHHHVSVMVRDETVIN